MSDPVARLRAAGCVWAEEEAALLLAQAREAPDTDAVFEALLVRRIAGEPVELVLGWVEFAGRRLRVAPGVFVPRRRTTLLARLAAAEVSRRAPAPVVVEMCCGVAPVAACLEGSGARVLAADVSADALACAAQNAPWASLHRGDLYAALPAELRGRVDVLVANAPYVPTAQIATMPPEARDHEPHETLDGGDDGVQVHRRLAAGAAEWLSPGGVVIIETSPAQAELTTAALAAVGMDTEVVLDDEVAGCAAVGTQNPTGGAGVTIPTSASASSICSREMPSR